MRHRQKNRSQRALGKSHFASHVAKAAHNIAGEAVLIHSQARFISVVQAIRAMA